MILRPIAYFINFVTGIIETLLGLRVVLKFLGANPATPFVNWVYETTLPLIAPFAGMFPAPIVEGQFIIEFSTIFAIIIYALISYFLVEILLSSILVTRTGRVIRTVDTVDDEVIIE